MNGASQCIIHFYILETFRTKVGFRVLNDYNLACPEAKGGNPTTGLSNSRLVTRPSKLSITFMPQYKEDRAANLTKYDGKEVKPKWITDI